MTRGSRPLPMLLAGIFLAILGLAWISIDSRGYVPRLALVSGLVLIVVFTVRHAAEIRYLLLQAHRHAEPGPTLTLLLASLVLALAALVSQRVLLPVDLTVERINSLSQSTRSALAALRGPLELDAFFVDRSAEWELARRYLDLYSQASLNVKVSLSDPDREPEHARELGVERSGVIIATHGNARTEIDELSEDAITRGILRILEGRPRRVGLVQGHGESNMQEGGEYGLGAWLAALRTTDVAVEEVRVLGETTETLKGFDALLIVHPRQPLYPSEAAEVRTYVDRGGRLGLWLEPGDSTGLEEYLDFHSLLVKPGVIRDRGRGAAALGLGPWAIPLGVNSSHPITAGLTVRPVAVQARPLEIVSPHAIELTIDGLLVTARAQSDPEDVIEVVSGVGPGEDRVIARGRQLVGAALEWEVPAGDAWQAESDTLGVPPVKPLARMAVFGDASLITNRYLGVGGNQDLAMKTVHWLTQQERFLAAEQTPQRAAQLRIGPQGLRTLVYAIEFGLPLAFVAAGLLVWLRRRGGQAV